MASKRNTGKGSSKGKRKSGGGRPPPRKRDGAAALRGMVIGAIVFALLAVFFIVPIAGATPFSHLVHALGLEGDEARIDDVAAPGMPTGVVIEDPKGEAKPLDEVTEEEQDGLDDLIEKKSK